MGGGMPRLRGRRLRARGEPEPLGIAACDGQRLHAHVGADTQRIRHLRKERQQQRAGACAEICDAQWTRSRSAFIDRGECRLNKGLGVGPRHQGRRRDLKRKAPEFAGAENMRNRLAGEAPLLQQIDRVLLLRSERAIRRRSERGMIEAKCMTNEKTCIQFG